MSNTVIRNAKKFDFITNEIRGRADLTIEEYDFFLHGEFELALCFLDEYHFKDIRQADEKIAVCKDFLTLAFVPLLDSGQVDTLLSFAKKIKYWKVFEDCIFPIMLKDLNSNVVISYLDFLIDNHTHFDAALLENFFLKNDNQPTLIAQFLLKSALYVVDSQKYENLFFSFIAQHKREPLIFKRLSRMENKLSYQGKKQLSNFMVQVP